MEDIILAFGAFALFLIFTGLTVAAAEKLAMWMARREAARRPVPRRPARRRPVLITFPDGRQEVRTR